MKNYIRGLKIELVKGMVMGVVLISILSVGIRKVEFSYDLGRGFIDRIEPDSVVGYTKLVG